MGIPTLYMTDLDGTLLDATGRLSETTIRILKPLIAEGLPLVCCTARSLVHTKPIVHTLGCQYPVVCYSGGMIYDPVIKEMIHTHQTPEHQVRAILSLADRHGLSPFIYTMADDGCEHVYYCETNSDGASKYLEDRERRGDYRFVHDPSFTQWTGEDCYFLSFMGEKDQLLPLIPFIESLDLSINLTQSYYYTNTWWLEITQKDQSKGHALGHLKERYNAKHVMAFGDTSGDIAMLQAADCGIAVANASDALKAIADQIIGSNDEDSVAHHIALHAARIASLSERN